MPFELQFLKLFLIYVQRSTRYDYAAVLQRA